MLRLGLGLFRRQLWHRTALSLLPRPPPVLQPASLLLPLRRPHSSQSAGRPLRRGEWRCRVCEARNKPGDAPVCQQCGAETRSEVITGDWSCPKCTHYNFAFRTICQKCETPNPSPTAQRDGIMVDAPGSGWTCPGCGKENGPHPVCPGCGGKRKARMASLQMLPGDWTCPSCSVHNFSMRMECFQCGEARDEASKREIPLRRRRLPGDWECPSCSFHNFAARFRCRKCEAPRLPDV